MDSIPVLTSISDGELHCNLSNLALVCSSLALLLMTFNLTVVYFYSLLFHGVVESNLNVTSSTLQVYTIGGAL